MKALKVLAICTLTALVLAAPRPGAAEERFLTLASTTSTENSGLFAHLIPLFEAQTGIKVRVVAVGTGQALRLARNGDADVLLVHHKPSEETFVAKGYGVARLDVMYNDFLIVGPADDPAGIRGKNTASRAFRAIAEKEALFVSRGDDSGTHKKEVSMWRRASIDVGAASGTWYRETGSGMGATLNTANALGAYSMTDRATWLFFKNKGNLEVLVEGDPVLFNQYGAILVSKERHPHVKSVEGHTFIVWLTSKDGQNAIADYKVDGKQLFFPNARGGPS